MGQNILLQDKGLFTVITFTDVFFFSFFYHYIMVELLLEIIESQIIILSLVSGHFRERTTQCAKSHLITQICQFYLGTGETESTPHSDCLIM